MTAKITSSSPSSPIDAADPVFKAARELADRVQWNRVSWPEAQAVARAIRAYDALVSRVADAIERNGGSL